mgnify:CR=1 FL=1
MPAGAFAFARKQSRSGSELLFQTCFGLLVFFRQMVGELGEQIGVQGDFLLLCVFVQAGNGGKVSRAEVQGVNIVNWPVTDPWK